MSSSAEFRTFLLSMCIEAPESTTISLSSSFVEDGAGDDQTSEDEQNVASSFASSFWILLAISHASLRAHRSCFKVSSSDLSSNTMGWTLSFPIVYGA